MPRHDEETSRTPFVSGQMWFLSGRKIDGGFVPYSRHEDSFQFFLGYEQEASDLSAAVLAYAGRQ